MNYKIIASGSKGNAVLLDCGILIDCGVPYKQIEPYIREIKLVLLTHWHTDHFNARTIRRIAAERPSVRFMCGEWIVDRVKLAGAHTRSVDTFKYGLAYNYGIAKVEPVALYHDVPNCGYKITTADGERVMYATDTGNLNGIQAPNFDLYLIEANHEADEIRERIAAKEEAGVFAYEKRAAEYHLSEQKCLDFIQKNAGVNSRYEYMHVHTPRKEEHYES